MVHNLIFYDIDMYMMIVKIFKDNSIYTVRVEDLGDNLRLTGFSLIKTVLTQIYVDKEYYSFVGKGHMYLKLDFSITQENILKYINNCTIRTDNGLIIKDEDNKDYKISNTYYFDNSIDSVIYKTTSIYSDMIEYIDDKVNKSLSKGKCKIKIDTDKLRNVFDVLYYLDRTYFRIMDNQLYIITDDFSFTLACDNKSNKGGNNTYKPNEVYECLRNLPSDRITIRFDEKSPLFIKSKYKGMTIEHTISQLQKIDEEV